MTTKTAKAVNKITKVEKRDGTIVPFDEQRIKEAIFKAVTATNQGDGELSSKLTDRVVKLLNRRFKKEETPHVEQIQNIVEEVLILEGLVETAKAYILYREQRRRIRETTSLFDESTIAVDKYLEELDWQVKENANMTYSLQGLNQYCNSTISKKYWLNKIYPKEIREAAFNEDFHIHNLDSISTYCSGWDLYDILLRGFGGVPGKLESRPPKHFGVALGQLVNFFYTLQGECYSSDTQVLTDSGWKYFYEVDREDDQVFTLNSQTNEIELQKPLKFYEFNYDGELYNFKSKKLDLLVTPNHNMVVDQHCFNNKGGIYRRKIVKAKDFDSNEHFIPKSKIEDNYLSILTTNEIGLVVPTEERQVKIAALTLPKIKIRQLQPFIDVYERIKVEDIKKVKYQGKVYCLEVPNHTLYVRRKGRACWCGNSAGAQAVSNFDTLLAPFIRYDNLNYRQVKQSMQEFLYNCMVPTRVGFQTPFLNVSIDIKPPKFLADQPVVIGGKLQKETYNEFQEEMNMFNKAFYEVMMEGDAKGRPFSVDSDSLCPIKNSEKIKLVKIGEYIDNLMKRREPIFIKENNCQVLDVRDLNLKCLGLKQGEINWQKINFLVRHPLDSLLKISTVGGHNVKVTPSHSILVLKEGQIQSFEASKLKKGDWLISPKIVPQGENKTSKLSLAEEFIKRGKGKGIYITKVFEENGKQLKQRRIYKNSIGKLSTFPLSWIADKLEHLNLSEAKISLAGSSIKISNYLPITKELVEFLGWYCAEGSAEKNKKYGGISLGFNLKKEKKQARHIANLIKKIFGGVPVYLREVKKRNLIEVRVHSKLLRKIITEIFEIKNHNEKRVPQFIFELSPEMKKNFLRAYFEGDAWLTEDIIVNSVSRELIYGVSTLLKQLNIFHTLTEYVWKGKFRYRINIWSNPKLKEKESYTISKIPIKDSGLGEIGEKILELKPYFYDTLGRKYKNTKDRIFQKFGISHQASVSLEKAKEVINFAQKLKIEIPPALKEIEKDNLLFLKIKKIEEIPSSNGMVYDFSTESENFVADQLLVHNTFPIPTVSIGKDFDWDNPALEPMWEATAKYGVNYFSNFVNSNMKPEDFRSMCLDGKEEILIKNSKKIKRLSIKEIAEDYKTTKFDKEGWAECKKEGSLEVLSLNPQTLKLEWSSVRRFLKIMDTEAIEITTEDGKQCVFSSKHPMAVYTPEGIKMKWAKDIKKKDYLLTLKGANDEVLSKKYQKMEGLTLDDDLAKILGYFTADGNYLFESRKEITTYGQPRGLQFTFKTGDKENLETIKSLIKKVFKTSTKEKQDPRYNTYYLYVYNSELARKLYNAGFKKYGRLPQILFNSPLSTIKSFLEFHFRGDGYEKRKEIHINDLELSRDIVLLYSLIGQPVTYKLRSKSQRIYLQHAESKVKNKNGWTNNPVLAERVPGWMAFSTFKVPGLTKSRMVGFDVLKKYNAQTQESLKIEKSDIYLIRVKEVKIKNFKEPKEFYDIELDKNHLFVHSLGQISFNCCRLRLDNRELYQRGGGLFGSAPLTGCYDEKTEILTENGWKSFKDLTKNENVFTLANDNRIELHKPTKLFQYDYDGEMYQFKAKSLDLLVTPNHRMVVDNRRKNKREFVEARDFKPDSHWIPKQGTWEGKEKKYFELPSVLIMGGAGPASRFSEEELESIRQMKKKGKTIYQIAQSFDCNPVTVHNICTVAEYGNRERVRGRYETPVLKIKMDDWLKFFGFWVAEGCTDNENIALDHGYRVTITQINEQKREEIKKVLDVLPFSYYEEKNNLIICNKQLWSYLRQFGNKYQKLIPKEIKNLSKRQLKILFHWLVKGDGHVRKTTGQINYWTASQKLADDLQEIILKLGWLGSLTAQKKKVSKIKGRTIKAGIVYTIGVQKTKHYRLRENNSQKVYYKGKVYCCEVPNHTVFVRRNGKVSWCGNSIGVVTINMPRIGYLSKTKKEFFDRLGSFMDLAKESLEIKRKALENFMEKGLYPYSKYYLASVKKIRGSYFGNHFSTIGLLGMNEALLNFIDEDIASRRGRKFALEVLDFMRKRLIKYQQDTGSIYNLEATPAEGTSYRQAKVDREKYPEIITAGTQKVPYYTNSSQLPVNHTDDVFKALKLQDELQCKYTGGCVEKGNKVLTNKGLLNIEYIVNDFEKLKPIKALSYNKEKKVSEWDEIVEAVKIDVKKHNKIRIKGERGLDITTSDWHPFFVLEKFKPNPGCPICGTEMKNIKAFASHIGWNPECKEQYQFFPKYKVIEKRADELKTGDYVLQNSYNLYPEKETKLNNDLMWLIGFFIGDGCISKFIDNRGKNKLERYKVRFFSEHHEPLEKIAKILNRYFGCDVNVIKNEKRGNRLLKEVSSSKEDVSKFFFNYGFKTGSKRYTVSIPQQVKKNINKNNAYALLSGLMDSDGHIDESQGDFEYYTVSPQLADDVLELCSRAGIMISKMEKPTKRKNEVNIYRLRVSTHQMTKIRDKLTNTVNASRIREYLSNRKKRYLPVVRVKDVSKTNVKDKHFYDLMTKKNHNYLAGKNTLVFIHNTVLHLFLGEQVSDIATVKSLVKTVFEKFNLPYITITPTFSICPVHGYIAGEHFTCPYCAVEQPCEVYSRIVGYLRPVSQWNEGKKKEYKERKEFKIKKDEVAALK